MGSCGHPGHPCAGDGAARDVAGSAAEADDELAKILLSLRFWALYDLNELGDSASQAIAVGKSLVADSERVLGFDHPDTLTSQNNLAVAYQGAGRPAEAIPLFERALAAQEQLLGPDHPDAVTTRNNLAVAYRDAGRPAEAIPLIERALAALDRLLGPDHPDAVTTRNNLAVAYQEAAGPPRRSRSSSGPWPPWSGYWGALTQMS